MPWREPHTRRTVAFVALTFIVLGVLIVIQYQSAPPSIAAASAFEVGLRDSAVLFLDVRSAEEYRSSEGRIPESLLIPLPELEQRLPELDPYRGRTLIVYCQHGQRSLNAAALLRRKGFNAFNLEGGILKWTETKYPVELEE